MPGRPVRPNAHPHEVFVKADFICPACRATISAPPSLAGESAPCPKCDADIDRWPAPVCAPGSVRVVPPPTEPAVWYYTANGAQRGPVTAAQVRSLIETGQVRATDLLWREGMPAWIEAGTIPAFFPAASRPHPAPPPPADDEDRRPIHVHVKQVVERDDDDRPRRRRPRCRFCGSTARPYLRRQVSPAGWVVFTLLLIFTIIFCFIGLFITEEVPYCPDCGARC